MVKVSICVPTYNNALEVERLLQSVHRQNYTDYEVNISDDSTNEETAELIEWIRTEWSWQDKLHYIHNEKPLGHIYNWNAAIKMAAGEYIKIMFSDDWFAERDSLEKMAALLDNNPQASMAFCGTMQVTLDAAGIENRDVKAYARAAGDWYTDRLAEDYRNLFLGNEIGAPSATLYRACGAVFDEKSNWASDMFLYFEILGKNPRFVYTKDPLVSIGIHQEQYTGMFLEKDIRKFNDMLYMYEKYKLRESEACRQYMLDQILKFDQGWGIAKRCGIDRKQYIVRGLSWFWKNTVLGYWNGAMHKLGVNQRG